MTNYSERQHLIGGDVETRKRRQAPVGAPCSTFAPPVTRSPDRAGEAYRLLGPPGCGKTTALASKWIPAAVEKYGADAVVVCSLTKAAAYAIVSKGLAIPRENVGTLHAFAFRSIGKPSVAQDSKRIEEWNATCGNLHRVSPAKSRGEDFFAAVETGDRKGDELLSDVERYRHQRVDEDLWPVPVRRFFDKWRAWKQRADLVDFTDMIEIALRSDCCPGDPAVLIIDEAQDCSRLELELVRHWGAQCEKYVLAGDADQSIFEFRGADAGAFMSTDVPEDHVYILDQSYRVPAAVQQYAARWIDKIPDRFVVDYKPKDEEGAVELARDVTMRTSSKLARRVRADVEDGHEVMILATCAYQLRQTIRALKMKGVTFHNPYRVTSPEWNPMRGGVDRLLTFISPMHRAFTEKPRLWTWEELRRWMAPISMSSDNGFEHGAKAHVERRSKNDRIGEAVTRHELRDVFTPCGFDILKAAITDVDSSAALDWYKSRVLVSKRKLFEFAFTIAASRGVEALAEEPRVIVGTIHSVKGGGTDVVYLSPDLSQIAAKGYAVQGRDRDAIIRQFYVGMTRATKRLVLLGPGEATAAKWLPITKENES